MKKYLSKLAKLLKTKEFWIFFFIFALMLTNSMHEKYPDEFDNISGGKYILHNKLPYKGFMSHHGPVPYFLASIVQIFSGTSFVRFRLIYTLIIFVFFYLMYKKITKSLPKLKPTIAIFITVITISATYFWLHMLLADTLAALLLFPAYIILLEAALGNLKLNLRWVKLLSILLALSLLTSLSYLFLIISFYVFLLILWFKSNPIKNSKTKKILLHLFSPFIIFLIYLLITRSFPDYYYQNIIYNRDYYIFNFDDLGNSSNPIRFAVVMAKRALDQIIPPIRDLLKFNIYSDIELPLLGFNILMILGLLISRNYIAILPVIALLLFSNPRTNSMNLIETGYQSAVYIALSLLNGARLITTRFRERSNHHDWLFKAIQLYSIILFFIFFTSIFHSYINKVYGKYMGLAPLIYDRPEIALQINNLLDEQRDYAWIGPFEFEELYYLDIPTPSKYHWLLPANEKSDKIRNEMIRDLNENKPSIIVFDRLYSALGAPAQSFNYFVVDMLQSDYTLIEEVKLEGKRVTCTIPHLIEFQCNKHLYLRNDRVEELANKMLDKGYIELVD